MRRKTERKGENLPVRHGETRKEGEMTQKKDQEISEKGLTRRGESDRIAKLSGRVGVSPSERESESRSPQKNFEKKFKKPLDKGMEMW